MRFGIVLNHDEMQFELWLMGQNAVLQEKYWEILKDSVWNRELSEMPTYSVLAVCLCDKIDFSKKDEMTAMIFEKAMKLSAEIEEYLKATDKTDKFST